MMISPNAYAGFHKDKSYKSLIRERDSLIREIRKLEKLVLNKDLEDEAWQICPDPEVRYRVSMEYLIELCRMMLQKDDYS